MRITEEETIPLNETTLKIENQNEQTERSNKTQFLFSCGMKLDGKTAGRTFRDSPCAKRRSLSVVFRLISIQRNPPETTKNGCNYDSALELNAGATFLIFKAHLMSGKERIACEEGGEGGGGRGREGGGEKERETETWRKRYREQQ